MLCKFPYNENFVVFAKKHAGGNGNLIINFAWPKVQFILYKAAISLAYFVALACDNILLCLPFADLPA